jgi:hypothetical protein
MTVKEAINRVTNELHNIDEIIICKDYKIVYSGTPQDYIGTIYDDVETKYVEAYDLRKIHILI